MAWFKKARKPIAAKGKDAASRVPEGLWVKCPDCSQVIYNKELVATSNVCPKCGHHFRINATERLKMLFDGEWVEYDRNLVSTDPLKFTDTKPYSVRLRSSAAATGLKDAIIVASGTLDGLPVMIAAMEYGFIGGSMSTVTLVTGAAGFAGSHLIDLLDRDPGANGTAPVVGWRRPAADSTPPSEGRVVWETIDLLDASEVRRAIARLQPSIIYHCAGAAHVGRACIG